MSSLSTKVQTPRWWREHSLTIVTVTILVSQTLYCIFAGAYHFNHEQPYGDKLYAWSGPFWMWWTFEYNLSLVADVFGGLYLINATKQFHEKGSPESGDE